MNASTFAFGVGIVMKYLPFRVLNEVFENIK
jgi:hypothetical protein